MNTTNSRRSFVKHTGAVLLSFQVLDLIPHAMAQVPGCGAGSPDSYCNTDITGGGKNPDQHCVQGQIGGYDDDAACKGAAANATGYDQDGVCGSPTGQNIGGQPIIDQDACLQHHFFGQWTARDRPGWLLWQRHRTYRVLRH